MPTSAPAHAGKNLNQPNELLEVKHHANGWTTERRQRQAELIKQWQPWKHSTGARTTDGKAKVSRNAYKGGLRTILQNIAAILRDQKRVINKPKL
ncbi:MAG: hypothetical protein PSV17_00440 [Methylotenera sp.]|uniref:hypothetical protein n=1 Tax=Methylotenera sp. TaxID=2051956 RepID=UPI00248A285C|nr:hypothetical protein [Methylotenera sp.]MDI1307884.1 hypothetical protein [Methylotenera sp.]